MKRPLVGVLAMAMVSVFGSGSAPAAPLHGKPAGVARPLGTGAQPVPGTLRTSAAASIPGAAGDLEPGSPSPYCSADPNDPCVPPLLYGGGPVMHDVTTQVIAWDPGDYSSPFPSGYVSGYEHYLADLSHDLGQSSNVSSVMAQYVDADGSAFQSLTNAPAITDSTEYPASGCTVVSGANVCLTDAQLQAELLGVLSRNGLSSDLSHSYILLLPPGVDSCLDSSTSYCEGGYFCGYHSGFYVGDSPVSYTLVPYTGSTYAGATGVCSLSGGPGDSALMGLDSIGTHELFESATDPLGDGYLDVTGNEVADECAWYFGTTSPATDGGVYNQLLDNDQYLIQEMWSNQDDSCEPGDGAPATASISASPSVLAGEPAGFTASLNGASAGGASYEWFYALAPYGAPVQAGASASQEITFPHTGTYTVWVQITDADGGTITGVTDVAVAGPPTSAFAWSPVSPVAGSVVGFYEEASAQTGSITAYGWNFGDGTSSSAADPTHAYTSAGSYTVTLTVTQSDGLSASVQHTITVTAPPIVTSVSTGSSASSSSTSSTGVTQRRESTAWLRGLLSASRARLRIASLLEKRGITTTVRSATASGRLTITWYATVKHRKVVVARGVQRVAAGARTRIVIKLTAAGRALLRRSRTVRVTVTGVYRYGSATATVTRRITLRR